MTEEKEEKKEEPVPTVAIVDKDTAKEIDNAIGTMMTNPNFMGIIEKFTSISDQAREKEEKWMEENNRKLQDIMTVLITLHQNQVLDHGILEKIWTKVGLTEEEAKALDYMHEKTKKASIFKE